MQADRSFRPWEPLCTRFRPGARSILGIQQRKKETPSSPPGVILLGGDWEGSQWHTTAHGARQGGAGGGRTQSSRAQGRGERGRLAWPREEQGTGVAGGPGSEGGAPALQLRQALRQKVVTGPEELQVQPCARVSATSTGLKGSGEPGQHSGAQAGERRVAPQGGGHPGWLPSGMGAAHGPPRGDHQRAGGELGRWPRRRGCAGDRAAELPPVISREGPPSQRGRRGGEPEERRGPGACEQGALCVETGCEQSLCVKGVLRSQNPP